jgi:hypothetical protein
MKNKEKYEKADKRKKNKEEAISRRKRSVQTDEMKKMDQNHKEAVKDLIKLHEKDI